MNSDDTFYLSALLSANPKIRPSSPTMKVYYHDETEAHPTAAHDTTGEHLQVQDLKRIGVLGYVGLSMEDVDKIAADRGYVARDEVSTPD